MNRHWTDEETQFLIESWGNTAIDVIAKSLGRSKESIINKKDDLKLGAFTDNHKSGLVTYYQLRVALGYGNNNYRYSITSWVEKRKLPIKLVKVGTMKVRMVDIDKFWKWAEKNQNFLDFSKFEKHALGKEPEWVDKKRGQDRLKKMKWKSSKEKWTKNEEKRLLKYLRDYKYTWLELSELMQRSVGAIQRKCWDMGIKERPLREPPHSHWSDEQVQMLNTMIANGCNYQELQEAIRKSDKAIRGKVFRIYGTENLDVVRSDKNESKSIANKQAD